MAKTKYQQLVSAKSSYCKGRGSKKTLNDKKAAYIADATKKGNHTKAEATKIANKVVNGKCSVSVGSTKKKKTTRKKSTTRRRKRAA